MRTHQELGGRPADARDAGVGVGAAEKLIDAPHGSSRFLRAAERATG